jgi:hypothetical protein
MSTNDEFERISKAWLADGPSELADRVLDAALREVHLTHQRRRLALWRTTHMSFLSSNPARLAAVVVVATVAIGGALYLLGPNRGAVGGPVPTPSLPPPTTAPSPTVAPSPTLGPIDTATWTTYTSNRYGFTIGHPADWIVLPSGHQWTFPADATQFPPPGSETFHTPADDVEVSAWSVAVTPGTSVLTWLQAYCPVAESNSPCTALQSRTVAVSMDGHAGSLVLFKDDTQAFILVGNRMYIVGCWRPESDSTVAPYGGASRLLKGFLSTMHLLPGGAAASPTPRPS